MTSKFKCLGNISLGRIIKTVFILKSGDSSRVPNSISMVEVADDSDPTLSKTDVVLSFMIEVCTYTMFYE